METMIRLYADGQVEQYRMPGSLVDRLANLLQWMVDINEPAFRGKTGAILSDGQRFVVESDDEYVRNFFIAFIDGFSQACVALQLGQAPVPTMDTSAASSRFLN